MSIIGNIGIAEEGYTGECLCMIAPFPDKLRIKYGLTDNPDDVKIARWAARVEELISSGEDSEQAGRKAALEVFGELDGILYFSQADTIEALLALAKAK